MEKQHYKDVNRKVLAAVIGSTIEFYDFSLVGILADVIGENFFPSSSESLQLVQSFTIFGAAFICRPLGGALLGKFGDIYGRRFALQISVALMLVPSFAVGCLPTYQEIQGFATFLLVTLRLVQGIAAGGELSSACVFVYEGVRKHDVGFYEAVLICGAQLGTAIALCVAAAIRSSLDQQELRSWGWRIPFLLTPVIGSIALYLLHHLEEGEEFQEAKKQRTSAKKHTRYDANTDTTVDENQFTTMSITISDSSDDNTADLHSKEEGSDMVAIHLGAVEDYHFPKQQNQDRNNREFDIDTDIDGSGRERLVKGNELDEAADVTQEVDEELKNGDEIIRYNDVDDDVDDDDIAFKCTSGMSNTNEAESGEHSNKMRDVLTNYYLELLILLCSLATWSPMVFAIFIWLPFYLTDIVGIKNETYNPWTLNIVMLFSFCVICPIFGNCVDKWAKRTGNPHAHRYCLVVGSVLTMILCIPAILLLQQHSLFCGVLGSLFLMIPLAIYGSTMFVFCVEQFAVQDRLTGVGYAYNLSHCVWTSTITSFLTLLAEKWSLTSPAYYMFALNGLAVLATTYGYNYVQNMRNRNKKDLVIAQSSISTTLNANAIATKNRHNHISKNNKSSKTNDIVTITATTNKRKSANRNSSSSSSSSRAMEIGTRVDVD